MEETLRYLGNSPERQVKAVHTTSSHSNQYDFHHCTKTVISYQVEMMHLLGAFVLFLDRLLGMSGSTEVNSVQILDTWHQILQGVARHLCQGLGLRTSQLKSSWMFAHNSACLHSGKLDITIQGNKHLQGGDGNLTELVFA